MGGGGSGDELRRLRKLSQHGALFRSVEARVLSDVCRGVAICRIRFQQVADEVDERGREIGRMGDIAAEDELEEDVHLTGI